LAAVEALAAGHGRVVPLVKQYCQDCHAGDVIEGDVDLSGVTSLDTVRRQVKVWQRVAEMVSSRQMPPPEADQPTDEERAEIGQWLHDFLKAEARARAGDPGRVVLRRLNNAEYTYTIRDLTGVDSLDPAKGFYEYGPVARDVAGPRDQVSRRREGRGRSRRAPARRLPLFCGRHAA
jgi:hypothetical protein